MDEPLRPSTLSEILDRTAQLYRSRFLVFFGIAFIPTAVLLVFAGALALFTVHFSGRNGTPSSPLADGLIAIAAVAALALIGLPALLAATALATAALNHAAARTVFGQHVTIRDSYRAVWQRGWRYVGLLVVQFAAVWIVPIAAWVLLLMIAGGLTVLARTTGFDPAVLVGIVTVVSILGLVFYGFWMALRLSLAFPAAVVEQSGAWAALKRSWSLGAGGRGRILLLYLLGAALNWILSIAVWVPALIILSLIPGADGEKHQQAFGPAILLIVYGAGFAVQAFTRPIYGIALILFYYDQRVRREAFDIEWMMLKAGLIVPPPVLAPSEAPANPSDEAQPWAHAVASLMREQPQAPEAAGAETAPTEQETPETQPEADPDSESKPLPPSQVAPEPVPGDQP